MEEFIEKYSKWFPYCEKEKLKEEMRQDLSAAAELKNENSGLNIPVVSGSLLVVEYIGKFNLYRDGEKWYTDNEGLICNTDEELIAIIDKWSEQ